MSGKTGRRDLLRWLGLASDHEEAEPANISELRNRALEAWIQTIPQDALLDAFLGQVRPRLRAELRQTCLDVLDTAGEIVTRRAPGPLDADFYAQLIAELKTRFPWLREDALTRISRYAAWFAWRHGL